LILLPLGISITALISAGAFFPGFIVSAIFNSLKPTGYSLKYVPIA
jgi:hypothetical protein